MKRFILLLLSCLFVAHYVSGAQTPLKKFYGLRVQSDIVSYSILINGVEQDSAKGGSSRSFYTEANQWLVRGENTIEARYNLPSGAPTGDAEIEVHLYWATREDQAEQPVVDYHWKARPDDLYPVVYTCPFDLDDFPETMLACVEKLPAPEGEVAVLSQEDKYAILSHIDQLVAAYLKRDFDAVYELQKLKFEDVATSRHQATAEELEELTSDARKFVVGLDKLEYHQPDAPLQFVVTGDNKLVHVVRSSSPEYALAFTYESEGEKQDFFIDPYFAKIDGKWVIIR